MTDKLTRLVWYWILRFLRWGHAKNFNHLIARNLEPKHAAHFLERGKAQNAFARRHGIVVVRFVVNLLLLVLLCSAVHWVAEWLFAHGYLKALHPTD